MHGTVEITSGRLRGCEEGPVCAFRGVPFAAAPTGANRFRPPSRPDGWDGVRIADRFGATGLAPVVVDQLTDALVAINRRGVALLLVEQSPQLIADIVDRVYLLEQGCIRGEGTLDALGGVDAIADHYLGLARTAPRIPPR